MTHDALPSYTVRVSARARHVRLVLRPGRGLEVVIPQGCDPRLVPGLVARRAAWVAKTMQRLALAGTPAAQAPQVLPQRLELEAAGLGYGVHGVPAKKAEVLETPHRLLVRGPDEAARLAALRGFVQDKARAVLAPWLKELSEECGLSFAGLRVGRQRTRWGSCSRRGVISLNCALLFLPRDLAEQVMVHELCHTRHMNHSEQYWDLVERLRPGGRRLERRLRRAFEHVPAWMETAGSWDPGGQFQSG